LATVAKKHGPATRGAVSELVPLLKSSVFETRFGAAAALSGFGTNAAPAIPVIERILSNTPEKFHDIMLHVLESCGAEARRAIPTLRRCLSHSNSTLRIQAARTLWRVDSSQRDAARMVARELSVANSPGTRIDAASLLWEIDKDPGPVVPVLIGLLKESEHPFAYRTIRLLKQIGPGAREAIPALEAHLKISTRNESYFLKAAEDALSAMSSAASNAPTGSP
jgi:HEAT repeat protein